MSGYQTAVVGCALLAFAAAALMGLALPAGIDDPDRTDADTPAPSRPLESA